MRQALLSLVLLLAASAATAAVPERGPDGLLRVPPLERVSDPAGILSGPDRAALQAKLATFESRQGAQIAVVLVPSTRPEPIEDFAHRVGEAWKIGRASVGDGLLVVVAVRDRSARIDVARSLEGAIPDVLAGRIVRENLAPHFAAGDFAGGLNEALDALFLRIAAARLAAPPGVPAQSAPDQTAMPREADDQRIRALVPFIVGGLLAGTVLRRLLGVLGVLLAAGGAWALVAYLFSSVLLGLGAALAVGLLTLFGAPMLIASQVLGARGAGYSGGFGGGGGGGFRSGGGGDFSGGGASGNW
jgi:uncharacterized protein